MSNLQKIQNLITGIRRDEQESLDTLHLTSYENRMSRLAESFMNSPLSYRYNFSSNTDPVAQTGTGLMLKGLPGVYELELAAKQAAKKMFSASESFFRPTSGLHATLCIVLAATEPGDTIYSIAPDDGGHFATKHLAERCGRKSQFIPWDLKSLSTDLEKFAAKIQQFPPDAILFEHGTPLFNLPVAQVRELVGDDVLMIYDASHTLGLIAGGEFQKPLLEGCNVIQGNTHKTFPGPQKGMIHFRDKDFADKVIGSIGAGLISNQHTHNSIALYITTLEMEQFGQDYARQMISNGKKLAESLANHGIGLVEKDGVYTTSHEVLIKGDSVGGHFHGASKLFASGFSVNARVAFRQEIIRLGTEEVTRRGMKESDMEYIAELFKRVLIDNESSENIKKDVHGLNKSFPNFHYAFDKELGFWQE